MSISLTATTSWYRLSRPWTRRAARGCASTCISSVCDVSTSGANRPGQSNRSLADYRVVHDSLKAVPSPVPLIRATPRPADEALDADTTLVFADAPGRRWLIRASTVLALCVYAMYLTYRALYTINPD